MYIKETPWEKRNLGVESSIEFYVNQDELWEDICEEIDNHNENYQVLHIQSGNTDVLMNAPKKGFFPVEMNIQLVRNLNSIEMPRIYKRFEKSISCNVANETEKEIILDLIRDGNIFSTDKVARDSYFGAKVTGERYAYWTQDVIDNGAVLLCMKYKDKLAAFDICVDKGDGIADAFLGGVFPEFKMSGLGFLPIFFITKYAIENRYKKIVTGVSSNNIPILKLHEMFGYSVESMSYCLVKHC